MEPEFAICAVQGPPLQGRLCMWAFRSIQCDGCDMDPIVGTRFRSLELHNFDLCSA